ncbi:MAG: sigma-70 family RNA polymerase sigma factor [Acidobacteria bacterium]|nr:MAG: sigma-70 family RNA polymerase sigma factor [Acidobacteriota bacterium]
MDADRDLVTAAAAGDLDAFESLVQRHQTRLVGYLRGLTNADADAEDLAQEAFLRAYRSLKGFRGTSSFRTWLYQIATNLFRNWLEKRRNQAPIHAGSIDEPAPGKDEAVEPPGELAPEDRHIQRDAIDRALAALPADQREAVLLRDVEGFDYREIAEQLGVPLGTVESRIFRGRARLKELLRSAGLRS